MSGASGLIGTALLTRLRADGHDVVQLVRRATRSPHEATWDPAAGELDISVIDGADAVINLSGAGIGDRRWTDAYRAELLDSRIAPTTLLARTIAACERRPAVFLSGSAIGFYGPNDDRVLDESAPAGSTFLADICVRWEAAADAAAAAGVRTVLLRTGIVLTPEGGALRKQLPLFRFGLGGKFGRGDQWQSWISIDDEVGAIAHLLRSTRSGPVNLTAPNPVTNAEFTRALGEVLRRPTFLPIPSFGPKLLLGGELADALLFTGQRVVPSALSDDGFVFEHPSIVPALRALLGR